MNTQLQNTCLSMDGKITSRHEGLLSKPIEFDDCLQEKI